MLTNTHCNAYATSRVKRDTWHSASGATGVQIDRHYNVVRHSTMPEVPVECKQTHGTVIGVPVEFKPTCIV